MLKNLLAILVYCVGTNALAQGSQYPVVLQIAGVTDFAGHSLQAPHESAPAWLFLRLIDSSSGKALGPADLSVEHEKLFHFFAYDQALQNYVHEHPQPTQKDPTVWAVKVTFNQTGTYRLWADITLASNGLDVVTPSAIKVMGTHPPNAPITELNPTLGGVDGISVLSLRNTENLHPGTPAMITFSFSRTDGTQPKITPYLGALAHVLLTDVTGNQVLHAHPMPMGSQLMLHTEFPAAGDYRLFVQFVDGGVLRTVLLSVRVKSTSRQPLGRTS